MAKTQNKNPMKNKNSLEIMLVENIIHQINFQQMNFGSMKKKDKLRSQLQKQA